MGNYRSPKSQHNVLKHNILQCWKADNSELETAIRLKCLSASIKKIEIRMAETCWNYIFRPSRAPNYIVFRRIRSKFKLIQALMHVFVTYKNEADQNIH